MTAWRFTIRASSRNISTALRRSRAWCPRTAVTACWYLQALQETAVHLEASRVHLQARVGELAAEELRRAQRVLGEITGQYTSDDLLGAIFSSFCIGK